MTDPTETPPTDGLEDEPGDGLTLAKNGWVRAQIGDQPIRLRPPFFGEYKRLRTLQEEVVAGTEDLSDELVAIGERIAAEDEASAAEDLTDTERSKRRRVLMRESARASRKFTHAQEVLWLDWWAQTIAALCVDTTAKPLVESLTEDGGHDLLPAYMAAGGTAARVMGHWRAGPLGRG